MKAIFSLLLLFLLSTVGCAVIGTSPHDSFATQDQVMPLNPNRSETLPYGSEMPPNGVKSNFQKEILHLEIDRTPVGSYVSITVLNQTFQGTLLRKEPGKLILVNSMSQEVLINNEGQKYARKNHIPFEIIERSQISHYSIVAPPSDKFAPKGLRYHSDDFTVDAFEFGSGRIQRWFEPPMDATMNRQKCSPVELEQQLAEILPGSQIALLDDSGQKYNAIFFSMGQDELRLTNCMTQEFVPVPDGNSQLRTRCVPCQTIPIQQISSFAVVSPPLSDLTQADDVDCCDLCVTDIIYNSGRRQSDWKSAQNNREVARLLIGRPKWWILSSN
jgi:hypothetical protein